MSSSSPETEFLINAPLIDENDDNNNKSTTMHPEELLHSISSFWVVIKPVTLTMLLSSFAVVLIQDRTESSAGINSYLVYDKININENSLSTGSVIGEAFINAFVIVGFVVLATFMIVLCYRFNCMKLLLGYMLFASITLLGFMGGSLSYSALFQMNLPIDCISFLLTMFNFSFVGVIAIFYQKGIPLVVTQGFLIATSVIMAWHLSKFPEWTTWALVVVLALYDLCAVLTPCGPLQFLLKLVETHQRPLPGLLYEADVPHLDDKKEKRRLNFSFNKKITNDHDHDPHSSSYEQNKQIGVSSNSVSTTLEDPKEITYYQNEQSYLLNTTTTTTTTTTEEEEEEELEELEGEEPQLATTISREWLTEFYQIHNPSYVEQVDQILLQFRGRENILLQKLQEKYIDDQWDADRTIKLGLGDFIFYSVLVSRAATYDFSAMVGCFVSIITGLGVTLLCLAAFEKALPALPISIFLAVGCYMAMRFLFTPFSIILNLPLLL